MIFTPQNCCMNITYREAQISGLYIERDWSGTYDFRTDKSPAVPRDGDEFFDGVPSLRAGLSLRLEGYMHMEYVPSGLDIIVP